MRIKFKKILVRVGIVFLVIIAVGLVMRTIFNYTTGKKLEKTLEKMKAAGEKLAIKEFEPDCRDEDNAALSWKGVEEILQIEREQRELLSKTLKEIFYNEPLTNGTRRKIEIMAEKNQRALLLIQDTGSPFEMSRPLLPGQEYPGLGLLRDTAAVLIVLCERLELDGLVFTPSHFHLASLARPLARHRDPELEGRFQAIQRTVAGLPLREAAEAVENGRVSEVRPEKPLRWKPHQLIIPVSGKCKAFFDSPDYRKEVARALDDGKFTLSERR